MRIIHIEDIWKKSSDSILAFMLSHLKPDQSINKLLKLQSDFRLTKKYLPTLCLLEPTTQS